MRCATRRRPPAPAANLTAWGEYVADDAGLDAWSDTTTLYTTIHRGDTEDGPIVGSGILHLRIPDLARQMTTFRIIRSRGLVTYLLARRGGTPGWTHAGRQTTTRMRRHRGRRAVVVGSARGSISALRPAEGWACSCSRAARTRTRLPEGSVRRATPAVCRPSAAGAAP
jgi:hypothetical protein